MIDELPEMIGGRESKLSAISRLLVRMQIEMLGRSYETDAYLSRVLLGDINQFLIGAEWSREIFRAVGCQWRLVRCEDLETGTGTKGGRSGAGQPRDSGAV